MTINGIKSRKEQERRGDEASREAEEGEEEKNSMKNTVKLREIERETKHCTFLQ